MGGGTIEDINEAENKTEDRKQDRKQGRLPFYFYVEF